MNSVSPTSPQACSAAYGALTSLAALQASAVKLDLDEIEDQLDSTLSVGASPALRKLKQELLGNGGADDEASIKQGERHASAKHELFFDEGSIPIATIFRPHGWGGAMSDLINRRDIVLRACATRSVMPWSSVRNR